MEEDVFQREKGHNADRGRESKVEEALELIKRKDFGRSQKQRQARRSHREKQQDKQKLESYKDKDEER